MYSGSKDSDAQNCIEVKAKPTRKSTEKAAPKSAKSRGSTAQQAVKPSSATPPATARRRGRPRKSEPTTSTRFEAILDGGPEGRRVFTQVISDDDEPEGSRGSRSTSGDSFPDILSGAPIRKRSLNPPPISHTPFGIEKFLNPSDKKRGVDKVDLPNDPPIPKRVASGIARSSPLLSNTAGSGEPSKETPPSSGCLPSKIPFLASAFEPRPGAVPRHEPGTQIPPGNKVESKRENGVSGYKDDRTKFTESRLQALEKENASLRLQISARDVAAKPCLTVDVGTQLNLQGPEGLESQELLRKQAESAREEAAKYRQLVEQSSEEVKDKVKEIASLQAKAVEAENSFKKELESRNKVIKSMSDEAEKGFKVLESKNEIIKSINDNAEAEIQLRDEEIVTLKKSLEKLQADLDTQLAKNVSLEKSLKEDHGQLKLGLETKVAEISTLKTQLDKLQEDLHVKAEQINAERAEKETLSKQCNALKATLVAKDEELGTVSKACDKLRADGDAEKKTIKQTHGELQATIGAKDREIAAAKNNYEKSLSTVQWLRKQLEERSKELTEAKENVSKAREDNKAKALATQELRNQVSDIPALKKTIEDKDKALQSLKSTIAMLENDNAALGRKSDTLEKNLQEIQEQAAGSAEEARALRELLIQGKAEFEELAKELDEVHEARYKYHKAISDIFAEYLSKPDPRVQTESTRPPSESSRTAGPATAQAPPMIMTESPVAGVAPNVSTTLPRNVSNPLPPTGTRMTAPPTIPGTVVTGAQNVPLATQTRSTTATPGPQFGSFHPPRPRKGPTPPQSNAQKKGTA